MKFGGLNKIVQQIDQKVNKKKCNYSDPGRCRSATVERITQKTLVSPDKISNPVRGHFAVRPEQFFIVAQQVYDTRLGAFESLWRIRYKQRAAGLGAIHLLDD